jgi:hypothetical protein
MDFISNNILYPSNVSFVTPWTKNRKLGPTEGVGGSNNGFYIERTHFFNWILFHKYKDLN